MEKYPLKKLGVAAVIISMIACNPLKKMQKEAENVKYDVTPNPLELVGDSVSLSISGKIPPEYFNKKALVDVTPMLKSKGENGEVVKEFKTFTLVGEAATGEGQVINQAAGGSFKFADKIEYKPAMEYVTLEAKIVGRYKTKSVEIGTFKVGDGTKVTAQMVMSDEKPIMATDNFIKVIPKSIEAQINFLINSSQVQSKELSDADIKALNEFIKQAKAENWAFKGVKISAYASPDGELSKNENLANDRAKAAQNVVANELKKNKVKTANDEGFYASEGKGEDWDGFKTAMQKSDIEDKELILRVLQMYTDLEQREKEIKNLAATYVEVADKILPGLRRSKITVMAEKQSRTDAQIQKLVTSAPDSLSVEEMLYAATLTESLDEKLSIYQQAKKQYASDWRTHNNVGYILLLQNKPNDAKAEFEAALNASPNNTIASNNLGIVTRLSGDKAKAKELYTAAKGAGDEVNYNMGIINIMEGDYASAVSNFGSTASFNSALATLLNGNNEKAIQIIDASEEKDLAASYYLKAISGARSGNKDLTINNLKTAFSKDSALKKKAKKDVEFIKLVDDEAYKNLF